MDFKPTVLQQIDFPIKKQVGKATFGGSGDHNQTFSNTGESLRLPQILNLRDQFQNSTQFVEKLFNEE